MADLHVCSDCGGVDGCRDTCRWSAPFVAQREQEKRDKVDLETLARLRAHKELPDVLSTAMDFAVNCRDVVGHDETDDPQLWSDRADAYELLLQLLRGNQ